MINTLPEGKNRRGFTALFIFPKLSILVLSILLCSKLDAQVSTYYTWSQSDQTYKSDTSTTSNVPANIFATGWDDNTHTGYTFPFNFTYNGTLYTAGTSVIGVDTDGWIAFSTTSPITMTGTTSGGSWVSISDHTGMYLTGTANNNGFCGFNSDIEDQSWTSITGNVTSGSNIITSISDFTNLRVGTRLTGTGITNGTVVTKINVPAATITISAAATATGTAVSLTPYTSIYAFIRGVAPYRQFVVQWTRAIRYSGAGTGDDFSFQLVLNEGGGNPSYQTLQTVYGVCKATATAPQNAQVGLRGASAADFNARTTTTNWAATTAAVTNTATCALTNAVFPTSGLTYTWSPACLGNPSNAGAITGPTNVCPGTTWDYSIPGVPGAIFYTWTYTGTNVTYSGTTTLPLNTLDFGITATGGTLTVTPGNLCGTGTSSSIVISMNGLPSATVTYPASSYCTSASPVTPTITGTLGGTFTSTPGGLTINAGTGQITPATSAAGNYVVTYTFTSGCTATVTKNISINAGPAVTASATPAAVCTSPNSSQLLASAGSSNYIVTSIAHSSLSPSAGSTIVYNTYQLDAISGAIAMPFTFNFYGSPITNFYVSTEGYIQLQTATAVEWNPQTLPNATVPNNIIALAWDDLIVDPSTNSGSSIRYFVNGTAPNRILVVDYINLRFLGGGSTQHVTGQIRLYESDSHIEIAATTVNDDGDLTYKTMGIENSTGTLAATPPGRNNQVWNISNEAWSFNPNTAALTYAWSPATYLSSTSIANPVATNVGATTSYTVTVTNTATGCSSTGNATITMSSGMGGTYTVGVGGNYTTLTAAVNAYNAAPCITAPIVFSLIDNTYPSETFPITINSNAAASSTNTLTIKPAAGKTPVITGSSTVAIIKMNGADYVTIDGSNTAGGTTRNLTLINTSTDYLTSTIVWMCSPDASNGATNNTVKNTIFTGNASTTTFTELLTSGSVAGNVAEAANSNNTVQNNLFTKGQTAIAMVGPTGNETGNIITGNTIGSTVAASKFGWSGIEIYQQANAKITNNTIFGITTSDFSITASGISVFGTASNDSIAGNTISDVKHTSSTGYGANGIWLASSSTAANVTVFNNIVFDVTGYGYTGGRGYADNGYGILVDDGGGYNIYFNTVHLNTNQTVNGRPACINITDYVVTAASVNIKNNIFQNSQTNGTHYAIQSTAANTVFGTINYNAYYSAAGGTTALGYIGSNRTALVDVQTGFGQNANSIQPAAAIVFTSATDMHILASNATNQANISDKGNPISAITVDYDNTTRNGLTPDLGADEWLRPNTGSWVGKISTDWLTNANWETNTIPDLNTDVYITGGYTYMPTVATTQAVRALSLSAPVPANTPILTINAGNLQVYGAITRTGGSINGSNGTMEMKGSAAQTIPASLFVSNNLKNLIVSNTFATTGVTLGGALDIYRSVTFGSTSATKLTTGGFLTFKSTATETAWLGQMAGSNAIVGDATVERYIPNHTKAWQFLATPITQTSTQTVKQAWQEGAATANGNPVPGYGTMLTCDTANAATQPTPGFDAYTYPGPSIKTFVRASNTYKRLNRTDTAISNPKGYMVFVRGDRSVITSGAAATATVLRTKGTLYTPANPPATVNLATTGFESVGNPYPSAINFRQLGFTGGVQTDFFYVWDPKLTAVPATSIYGYGGFQTFSWNGSTFNVTPGGGSYSGSNRNIESGQAFFISAPFSAGTLSFSEAAKASASNLVTRQSAATPGRQLRTNLYVSQPSDRVLIDGNLVEFDNSYSNNVDIKDGLKLNNLGENLGLSRGTYTLAVERRKPVNKTDTIFYRLGQLQQREYLLEFIPEQIAANGLKAYLEDLYLNSSTEISLAATGSYTFTVNADPASAVSNRFRLVFKQKKNQKQTIPVASFDERNKLQGTGAEAEINIYPNPVTDHVIRFELNNQPAGVYLVKLQNKLGQVLYNGNITVVGTGKTQSAIKLDKGLAAGVYQVVIIAPDGTTSARQLILE